MSPHVETRKSLWILFLNPDGTVTGHQKISDTQGNFLGDLTNGDWFGHTLAAHDFNGDGIVDLAAGAHGDDDGGLETGAVWILYLDTDGTVQGHRKISALSDDFLGDLDPDDRFGTAVTVPGDVDGDSVHDLVVGAQYDDDGGTDQGAQWILFLNRDVTIRAHQKISDTEGCFAGVLDDGDRFGLNGPLGDMDGDDVVDLAVGELDGPNGGSDPGAVWILHLDGDGTVKSQDKISDGVGCFDGDLDGGDGFGISLKGIGDLDGNGVADLAVGAWYDDDGGPDRGAVWLLFLHMPPSCPADVFADCAVGVSDLLHLLERWGACEFGCSNCPGDLNGDGEVGTVDLLGLLALWGPCP